MSVIHLYPKCDACNGRGWSFGICDWDTQKHQCYRCGGRGLLKVESFGPPSVPGLIPKEEAWQYVCNHIQTPK